VPTILLTVVLVGCMHQQGSPAAESLAEARSAEWLYTEQVVYQENHDPSDIYLTDGRDLRVTYGAITWMAVQQWKAGRKLTFAYSEAEGCMLVDAETNDALPVIAVWAGRHPLDVLLAQDLALTRSTLDIVEAYDASVAHWEREIVRLYDFYLSSDKIPAGTRQDIQAERAAWEDYRDRHAKAAKGLYALPQGTMWNIKGSEHYHELVRSQAIRLQEMVETIDRAEPAASSGAKQSLDEHKAQ